MFSHQELFLFCSDLLESILLGQKNLFLSFLFFFFNMVPGQWSSELNFAPLEHTVKPFHSDLLSIVCAGLRFAKMSAAERWFPNTEKWQM